MCTQTLLLYKCPHSGAVLIDQPPIPLVPPYYIISAQNLNIVYTQTLLLYKCPHPGAVSIDHPPPPPPTIPLV